MKSITKFLCLSCLLMSSSLANAEQEFVIENNGTIVATVSKKEITRIAFLSSVDSVHSIAGELEYNIQGNDLYLRTSADKPINFFVKVTSGLTYKFILDVCDIPATQIFVNSANDNFNLEVDEQETVSHEGNGKIRQRIAKLIDIALYPKNHLGFSFSKTNRDLGNIDGIALYQIAEITGQLLKAQKIEITNECEEIKEIELSQFLEPGILAVHTDKAYLKPNEKGILIRVMEE